MAGRYLLDSHVFLELAGPERRFSPAAQAALEDTDAQVHLSVVSVAEICIKSALGKLPLPAQIERDPAAGFRAACEAAGFTLLPLSLGHAAALNALPPHHRDPFDRLLIAQAMQERLVLISRDTAFAAYEGLALLRP